MEAGLVDPYFRALGRDVKRLWTPTAGTLGGSEDGAPGAAARNLLEGWRSTARAFARSGSPYGETPPPDGTSTRPVERDTGGHSGFDHGAFLTQWNAGEFAFVSGLVLVQLVQSRDGAPLDVRVVLSSGHALLDETARSALAHAAAGRLPPAEGLGLSGDKILSLWRLEARIVPHTCTLAVNPADRSTMPVCGGTFDEVLGTVDPQLPGTTGLRTRVELIAVHDGARLPLPATAP